MKKSDTRSSISELWTVFHFIDFHCLSLKTNPLHSGGGLFLTLGCKNLETKKIGQIKWRFTSYIILGLQFFYSLKKQ